MTLRKWRFIDLGTTDFATFLHSQNRVWRECVQSSSPYDQNTMIFAEHPPTISLGARPTEQQLKFVRVPLLALAAMGVPIYETRRGGSLSLHARGILGCYVVFRAAAPALVVTQFEEIARATCAELGVHTVTMPPCAGADSAQYRGAWTSQGKIASIGIHISQCVTRFGMNLNISADPNLLKLIHPCGITDYELTTLKLAGVTTTVPEVKRIVRSVAPRIFAQ